MGTKRVAVVLFNLGGPNRLQTVKPFLYNLFSDPAIIDLPSPLRQWVARFIAYRRTPEAQKIYRLMGGKSPLLENTQAQAHALEEVLNGHGRRYRVFIAMRYCPPRAKQALQEVLAWKATEIVLLPLYPQFSTTTTWSSLKEWQALCVQKKVSLSTQIISDYPTLPGFIGTLGEEIKVALGKYAQPPRLLLSAHGLPKRMIQKGDPYQKQVEQTAQALKAYLNREDLEFVCCYQSKVGPLPWIGPSTKDELKRAAQDGRGVLVVPHSFVSEHSETLVELDIEYKNFAHDVGVPFYERIPTVQTSPLFIQGLADLVVAPSE